MTQAGRAHCLRGMGYLRLDLPVGHRYFGKIFLCECTRG